MLLTESEVLLEDVSPVEGIADASAQLLLGGGHWIVATDDDGFHRGTALVAVGWDGRGGYVVEGRPLRGVVRVIIGELIGGVE